MPLPGLILIRFFAREAALDSPQTRVSPAASAAPAIASGTPAGLARAWLWLGVLALIGSGVLAVLLVLSRTPGIQDVFPLKDLFRAALVVHVDLSVAVWFMAFAAVIWCAVGGSGLASLGWSGVGLAALGTALMSVSPFFPGAEPVLNNYIPVLRQPLFFASLWIFAAGASLTVLRALITTWPRPFLGEPLRLGAHELARPPVLGASCEGCLVAGAEAAGGVPRRGGVCGGEAGEDGEAHHLVAAPMPSAHGAAEAPDAVVEVR